MLLLPTFNATLTPCPVGPAAFSAHPQGYFCGHCQRVVQDFSQSTNPVADLAAARAAAPDGRVCGMFRRAQTTALPPLTRRLRWFLMALVLVLGQGLTAREALAQVRKAAHTHRPAPKKKPLDPVNYNTRTVISGDVADGIIEMDPSEQPGDKIYTYVEQMPTFRGSGIGDLVTYIQQQVRRPATTKTKEVEGRVFVSFTVGKDGLVRDAKIVKGLQPPVDAEVLQVVRELTGFVPGKQNGQEVAVSMTVPITFTSK